MQTIMFIVLGLLAISGWAYACYVNDDWFKHSVDSTDGWFKKCVEVNDTWYERNVELAKKVDELTAENYKMKKRLIELGAKEDE